MAIVTIKVEPHVEDYLKGAVGDVIDFKMRSADPNIKILSILMDRPAHYRTTVSTKVIENYQGAIQVKICDKWLFENKHGLTPCDTVIFNNLVSYDIYDKLKEQLVGAGKQFVLAHEWRRFIDRYNISDAHFPYERVKKYFQRHKLLIIN